MSDRSAELDARREVVEQELGRALGNASLCSVSRSAGSVPAAKHLEGRLAALREVRREVRAGGALDAACERVGRSWREALAEATERGAGRDWVAYRAGGVDELEELVSWAPGERG